MHVLAIYSINEHLGDLMAEAANERRAKEAKAARPKTSRFAFLTSRFAARGSAAIALRPHEGPRGLLTRLHSSRSTPFLDNSAGGLLPARLHPPGHRTPPRRPGAHHARRPSALPGTGVFACPDEISGRWAGRCRRGCDRPGRGRARSAAGIVAAWSASRSARSDRRFSARSALAARLARSVAIAIGRVAGGSASRIAAPVPGSSSSFATSSCMTAGARRGMSAPTTSAMAGAASAIRIERGREAGERSAVRRGIPGDRDAAGEVGRERRHVGVRREDEDDLVDTLRDALEGVVDERATVERGRDLVAAEAARRAAGEDDPDGPRHGVSAVAAACARIRSIVFGTEDVAGVRPAEDPAPVEVLEQHEDVAAARAGLVAERGGGERRLRGQLERAAGEVLPRRACPGEVVLEADDAPVAFERLDAVGRATGGASGVAERRRGGDRERGLEPVHGRKDVRRQAGRPARIAQPVAVPGEAARPRSPCRRRTARRGRPPSGRASRRRRARIARFVRRAGSVMPGDDGSAAWCARTASTAAWPQRHRHVRREADGIAIDERAVEIEPRGRRIPATSAAARPAVRRRREIPRGGSGSSTTPPPAVEPGDGCRSANRSPDAAAIGRASRRIARDEPSGRSIASRGPRTTSASTWSVPRWSRSRSRSAGIAGRRTRGEPGRPRGARRGSATWRRPRDRR